jgi:hypothetical protein
MVAAPHSTRLQQGKDQQLLLPVHSTTCMDTCPSILRGLLPFAQQQPEPCPAKLPLEGPSTPTRGKLLLLLLLLRHR